MNRKIVYGFGIVVAVIALIGAVLFGAYIERETLCCASPEAMQKDGFWLFIEFLAAISGPVGGGIAIFIAIYGDRQADKRQEKEWKKRQNETKKEREKFQENIISALYIDIKNTAANIESIYTDYCEKSLRPITDQNGKNTISFNRIINSTIYENIADFDGWFIEAIIEIEPKINQHLIQISNCIDIAIKRNENPTMIAFTITFISQLMYILGIYMGTIEMKEKVKIENRESLKEFSIHYLEKAGIINARRIINKIEIK